MSVVVVATIVPLPEHRDAVIAAFEQTIPAVHPEDGCELYALHEGKDQLVMVEKWASAEALEVHMKSPALAGLGPLLEGKLASAPEVLVYTPRPAGSEKGVL